MDNVHNLRESSTNNFNRKILVINNIHSIMNIICYRTTVTVHVVVLPSTLTVTTVVPALRAVIKPVEETAAVVVVLTEYVAAVFVASPGAMIGWS